MAQTALRIVVDGFQDSEFDFASALQRAPAALQTEFEELISALVAAEEDPTKNIFWSVTIVGHADRDDVPGVSSEQRRATELNASEKRAGSALAFVFTRLGDKLSADGFARPAPPPAGLDALTNVGIVGAFAGAADLVNLAPASEAERAQNRRVKFLAIQFSPQPQAVAFGEQNFDRNVA
jgi:flagellar motor protein MotB